MQSGRLPSLDALAHGLESTALLVAERSRRLESRTMHADDAQGVASLAASRLARSHDSTPSRPADRRVEGGLSDTKQSLHAWLVGCGGRICRPITQYQPVIDPTGD